MTDVQFRRWYTFAIRMAHRGLTTESGRRLNRKARRLVAGWVKDFFRENFAGEDGAALMGRVMNWDHTRKLPGDDGTVGFALRNWNPSVSALVDDLMGDGTNPHYWGDDGAREAWDELWGGRVRCCLRAGLDLASSPSAGVLGFDAGDLRRMYRGQVPSWIADDPDWTTPFAEIPDEAPVWL